jgi:hypothetical protein
VPEDGRLLNSRATPTPSSTLLKQINSETNKAKRKQLFAQGMKLLDQTAPLYPSFTDHLPMWTTSRATQRGLVFRSSAAWTPSGWTEAAA